MSAIIARKHHWQSVESLLVVIAVLSTSIIEAKEILVTPETEFKKVVKNLEAGDSIVFADGQWKDIRLTFERLRGTSDAPIRLRAQTPGEVVFTGQSEFRCSGTFVVVSGLVFKDITGISDVVQLRTHSERHAHHCRITDCVFEQTKDFETKVESRWLSIYGMNNRVDHCRFSGKQNRGTTLVVWVSEDVGAHRIDRNYFGPRPELGRNGGETIRIGTSEVSERNCRTHVEHNYFFRCNGEAEIISNKSCENVYRHNVFESCAGALTLRHGHRCLVDGNIFLGNKERGTGGVRIIGRGHVVTNNYFEALRGDAERAAICFMNGIPNSPLNGYAPVHNAIVSHNTLIDCKVTLEIGVGAGKQQSAGPSACQVRFNAFLPGKWPLFRVHAEPKRFAWGNNLHQPGKTDPSLFVKFEQKQLRLSRAEGGLLRPTELETIRTDVESDVLVDLDGFKRSDRKIVGCDDPTTPHRTRPSHENTGPRW